MSKDLRHLIAVRFLSDETGATAIEYAVICAGIFLVIIAAVTLFATRVTNMWSLIASNI